MGGQGGSPPVLQPAPPVGEQFEAVQAGRGRQGGQCIRRTRREGNGEGLHWGGGEQGGGLRLEGQAPRGAAQVRPQARSHLLGEYVTHVSFTQELPGPVREGRGRMNSS